jgi:predicted nucleic acid-binding protein
MDEIFADAFYWIALANPSDQWHTAAKRFDVENPNALLVTTEEVLTEFLNYYAESGTRRRKIVSRMCEQVLIHPNITIVEQSHESFSNGFELFRQREDKGYSLTDCISMSLMRERGTEQL